MGRRLRRAAVSRPLYGYCVVEDEISLRRGWVDWDHSTGCRKKGTLSRNLYVRATLPFMQHPVYDERGLSCNRHYNEIESWLARRRSDTSCFIRWSDLPRRLRKAGEMYVFGCYSIDIRKRV